MHEYSIVASLIERVEREATARSAHVRRLHVAIGEAAGVEIELLRTAFETFRARSVCEDAELTIRAVPVAWRCPGCGQTLAAGAVLRCPACARPARMVAGDEIILERIELEVPDV